MAFIARLLLVAVLAAQGPAGASRTGTSHSTPGLKTRAECSSPVEIPTVAKKINPFRPLTQQEINDVVIWLARPEHGLNLTSVPAANQSISDNRIVNVEDLRPNKTDVLAYLDGDGPLPRQYARVVINEGGKTIPVVTDYQVGPLPVSSQTKLTALSWIYTSGSASVPINAAFPDRARNRAIDQIVSKTMASIADITKNLTGLVYYGSGDRRNTAAMFVQNPTSLDGTRAIYWSPWRRVGLSIYNQPTALQVSFDVSGTDASLYKFRMIYYDGKVFDTLDAFRTAFENGEIKPTPSPNGDEAFLRKDRIGAIRELENRFAPTTLELGGKRYKVDRSNGYVEYLGWQFYTRFCRETGIEFFDIRFKGERVLYELSLNDAIAQYAGDNPFQAGTGYTDRYYGIGASAVRPVPGFDCPYGSTYLDVAYNWGQRLVWGNRTICIFEMDLGYPVTRHNDPGTYIHSTKGSALVVRFIATVGNYDYLWDYSFLVDGTIKIDARASGYLQGNYYRPQEKGKWGPRINEYLAGTLHTHVMNFKADFDILDTENTFLKTDIVVENITAPWFPELGSFEMMGYKVTELASEDDAIFHLSDNGQAMYTVVNKARLNKWDQPRGYRIIPAHSNVVLAAKNSPFFLKSGQHCKQPLAVTRQHDTEPYSTAAMNQNLPLAPPVEFYRFFNGESLVQEDLVAWVNLGMHHFTRAEDLPNTLMTEAHSSVIFSPHNWGDSELTTDLTNAVIFSSPRPGGPVMPPPSEPPAGPPNAGMPGPPSPTANTNGVEMPQCLPLGDGDSLQGFSWA